MVGGGKVEGPVHLHFQGCMGVSSKDKDKFFPQAGKCLKAGNNAFTG